MTVLWLLGAAAGAVLGSYLTTAAIRQARGEPHLAGRSRCDGCGRGLGFAETAPLVSFAIARGACRGCRAPIHPLHPAGEAAGSLCGLAVAGVAAHAPWTALALAALGACLLPAAVTDALTRRLPDGLTAAAAAACGALAWLRGGPAGLLEGVAAAALAVALMLILRRSFAAAGRDPGLGLGDVKLVAALCLWLGAAAPAMVGLAAVAALAFVAVRPPADNRIAFGPALAAAGLIVGVAREPRLWPV